MFEAHNVGDGFSCSGCNKRFFKESKLNQHKSKCPERLQAAKTLLEKIDSTPVGSLIQKEVKEEETKMQNSVSDELQELLKGEEAVPPACSTPPK